jgi:hypothetical protein
MKRFATIFFQTSVIAVLCFSMTACSVDAILSDIDLALQTAASLETAIGAISPADAAALQMLTGIATAGLNAIQADYDAYEKNKTSGALSDLLAAAQALQANLRQNLAALHLESTDATTKATAWVNLIVDIVAGIVKQLAPTAAASPAITTRSLTIALPTAESLQARWQSGVCAGDTKCGSLVKVHHKRKW